MPVIEINLLRVRLLFAPFAAQGFEFTGAKWSLGNGQVVDYVVNRQLSTDIPDDGLVSNQFNGDTHSGMRWAAVT